MTAGQRRGLVHVAGVLCCTLLTAGAYMTAIQPVLDAQIAQRSQQAELLEQQRIAGELDKRVAQIHREVAMVNEELERSQLELESAGRINQRIAELTEIANDVGLTLQQIDPGQKHSERLFDMVPIELAGISDFRQYLLFLHRLHARFSDIAVSEFQIIGTPENPAEGARFHLTLCWFTARETTASGQ